jgi:hypothetical protein
VGHGEEVEDGVGGAAEGDDDGDGVFEGLFVMMSRGDAASDQVDDGGAGASAIARLSSEMAAWAELLGRLMPRASMALAMVLAVYMPPQEPGPGMAQDSTVSSSSSEYSPAACFADGFEDGDDVEVLPRP